MDKIKDLETDEEILEVLKNKGKFCNFQNCKAKISLFGHCCEYCKEKYCYDHANAIMHGCGQQQKKDYLSKMKNGPPQKPLTTQQRNVLQNKLHKKLEDMKNERTKKGSKDQKGRKK